MAPPSAALGARLKETVTEGELPLVVDRQRLGAARRDVGKGAQGHGIAGGGAGRWCLAKVPPVPVVLLDGDQGVQGGAESDTPEEGV